MQTMKLDRLALTFEDAVWHVKCFACLTYVGVWVTIFNLCS